MPLPPYTSSVCCITSTLVIVLDLESLRSSPLLRCGYRPARPRSPAPPRSFRCPPAPRLLPARLARDRFPFLLFPPLPVTLHHLALPPLHGGPFSYSFSFSFFLVSLSLPPGGSCLFFVLKSVLPSHNASALPFSRILLSAIHSRSRPSPLPGARRNLHPDNLCIL